MNVSTKSFWNQKMWLTFLGCFISFAPINAQDYYLNVLSEPYEDLTDTISINEGLTWDDPMANIPIGFDFIYQNEVVDTVYLSGELDAYSGTLFFKNPATFDISTDIMPALNFTFIDLIDRGVSFENDTAATTNSLSPISYKVEGDAGSQIFKIEWKNCGTWGDIDADDESTEYFNIQVWMYEGSNNIEIRYGERSILQPFLSYDGLPGDFVFLGPYPDLWSDDYPGLDTLKTLVIAGPTSALEPALMSINIIDYLSLVGDLFLANDFEEGLVYQLSTTPLDTMNMDSMNTNLPSLMPPTILKAYPNPTQNTFALQGIRNETILQLNIYNNTGKIVKTAQNHLVDIADLTNGIYFVEIQTNKQKYLTKVIKD